MDYLQRASRRKALTPHSRMVSRCRDLNQTNRLSPFVTRLIEMNRYWMFLWLACLSVCIGCQRGSDLTVGDMATTPFVVEAACGECQFGMPGTGCDLAVRIDGQAHYVDGSSIDEHGDAHAKEGLCNCIRKARVSGSMVDGRFVATGFTLLSQTSESTDAPAIGGH